MRASAHAVASVVGDAIMPHKGHTSGLVHTCMALERGSVSHIVVES